MFGSIGPPADSIRFDFGVMGNDLNNTSNVIYVQHGHMGDREYLDATNLYMDRKSPKWNGHGKGPTKVKKTPREGNLWFTKSYNL